MANYLKLKVLGTADTGFDVYLIKTVEGKYGVAYLDDITVLGNKDKALGYGAHLVNPKCRVANQFWKSMGLVPH